MVGLVIPPPVCSARRPKRRVVPKLYETLGNMLVCAACSASCSALGPPLRLQQLLAA
jgi:hypothetical protein